MKINIRIVKRQGKFYVRSRTYIQKFLFWDLWSIWATVEQRRRHESEFPYYSWAGKDYQWIHGSYNTFEEAKKMMGEYVSDYFKFYDNKMEIIYEDIIEQK